MGYVLGIDTGGTYTDACLISLENKAVTGSGKALTNKNKLIESIENALSALESGVDKLNWKDIKQISLSTTLATNSIVENTGCRVGLITIGKKMDQAAPTAVTRHIEGGHNNSGEPLAELDLAELEKFWPDMDSKVDAFAVAGYMGIRNPAHEISVQDFIRARTDKPIVCAHRLSRDLGFQERAVTAVLNARILPLIEDLLASAQFVFEQRGLKAPIMVVKGDGTLFPMPLARQYPVETVLSGPAASIIGACYLSGVNEATVIDMGGTTMDIATVNRNLFASRNDGVTIGGWKTKVKTIHSDSVGLGGDSHITFIKGQARFGPRRVMPLSLAANYYPEIIEELRLLAKYNTAAQKGLYEFIVANPAYKLANIDRETIKHLDILGQNPLSMRQIDDKRNSFPGALTIIKLEEQGLVNRISLTPTDLLHALGRLSIWNNEAPTLALNLFTATSKMEGEELAGHLYDQFVLRIAEEILSRLLEKDLAVKGMGKTKVGTRLMSRLLDQSEAIELELTAKPKKPLLVVGAPVKAYFPEAAKLLNAELIIPEHTGVANAAGASIAPIFKQVPVTIRPYLGSYSVHSALKRVEYETFEDAVDGAIELAKIEIADYFEKTGINNPHIVVETKENRYFAEGRRGHEDSIFIDAKVIVQGIGYPVANPFDL